LTNAGVINITGSGCNHLPSDDFPASLPFTARSNVRSQRLIVLASQGKPTDESTSCELPLYFRADGSRDKLLSTTNKYTELQHGEPMQVASIPRLATTSIPLLAQCIINCICSARLDRRVAFFPHNLPYWVEERHHQSTYHPYRHFPSQPYCHFPSSP